MLVMYMHNYIMVYFSEKKLMKFYICLMLSVTLLATGCTAGKQLTTDDGKIEAVFVQVNDVYEIAPVAGGTAGGMARVATIKKQEQAKNPNTFLIMAGDFVSPSVYNSLKYNGKRIRGAQMIEAMNSAGTDIAVFGNHEFDITESELQERINELGFNWVSSNTFHKTAQATVPFSRNGTGGNFPEKMVLHIKDNDGTTATIGIIGLTLAANRADFVTYADPLLTAKKLYNELKDSVDAVVAITHQTIAADKILARELPQLALILGGHEHSGMVEKVGKVTITKAEANARTAYILRVIIDKNHGSVAVKPELKQLNASVPLDSLTNLVVKKWSTIAEESYSSLGFDPKKVVVAQSEPLDGREAFIRSKPTNLTRIIAQSMAFACPQADVVIYNAGSIRLDDVLTPPITQYDILRSLPFGGAIVQADMKGSLLTKVLKVGLLNTNSGGYLQYEPAVYNTQTNSFYLHEMPIEPNKIYRVAMSDYLFSGKEANLDFLTAENVDVVKSYPVEISAGNLTSDIRLAIVKYLESLH